MRAPVLAVLVLCATFVACEPLSATREGRDDAVRYQLPRGAVGILEGADRLEIFALGDREDEGEPRVPGERFAGLPVLGRAVVPPSENRWVASALYRAIVRGSMQALCFVPHHGLRARRGDEVLELAICYGCLQMDILGREGALIAIAPSELARVIDPYLEEQADLRFLAEDEDHPYGHWAPRDAE